MEALSKDMVWVGSSWEPEAWDELGYERARMKLDGVDLVVQQLGGDI